MKDAWLTSKANSVLLVSNEAEGARYDVSTINGKITVRGTVLSAKQSDDIQNILEDLQGVKEVDNKLKIR
ncbi:MAG: BON domain-containing protein [Desulfobulbaceae bacterium]|nr:BON domain-containing protein [Desulfobulbaceae bacterium]